MSTTTELTMQTATTNETCDRCGPAVGAVYRVNREGELYLCGHCTNQLWPALAAQGWTIEFAGERALAPQPPHDTGDDRVPHPDGDAEGRPGPSAGTTGRVRRWRWRPGRTR
jgi:hypothetical protein